MRRLPFLFVVSGLLVLGITCSQEIAIYEENGTSITTRQQAVTSTLTTGTKGDRIELGSEDTELVVHGTIRGRIHITLTDKEIADLAKESPTFFNKIGLLGWRRTGNTFYKYTDGNGLSIHTADLNAPVEKGRFALFTRRGNGVVPANALRQQLRANPAKPPFSLRVHDITIPDDDVQMLDVEVESHANEPIRMDIVINVDYKQMKGAHQHLHQNPANKPDHQHGQGTMGWLWQRINAFAVVSRAWADPMERCMDYNGPWSDGVNYASYDPRAWRNFVNSDCDLAGAGACSISCWLDHYYSGCQANHGKVCSYYIGHSSSYHSHGWSEVITCTK